jgi:hypothetical protein
MFMYQSECISNGDIHESSGGRSTTEQFAGQCTQVEIAQADAVQAERVVRILARFAIAHKLTFTLALT